MYVRTWIRSSNVIYIIVMGILWETSHKHVVEVSSVTKAYISVNYHSLDNLKNVMLRSITESKRDTKDLQFLIFPRMSTESFSFPPFVINN